MAFGPQAKSPADVAVAPPELFGTISHTAPALAGEEKASRLDSAIAEPVRIIVFCMR
jgi:hypothetical protein